ncbi:SDR family NAD(P)-dependent oxidoreductase [Synechococcus sp. MIT S9504]|uniref:SDR family NAD(P)-dependent oxidoreductase n=1 Tax=Synechococcus sp. MIT S9504 TaxID=1801628 RepID=UPI0007BB12DC|nr:SDR family NAD(P)-dependent oxidoreductase [Synechococcus sp. MIT S9504]KZR87667.1 Cyclopentanol dehydrogenase [Synechococcus sp. MIT S9504]
MTRIDLSGGLVVVTGGAGSIGSAVAVQAAQAGASVAVCDTNYEAAERIAEEIRSNGGVSEGFHVDVTDATAVREIMQRSVGELGEMRGLVTAAGLLRTGPLATQTHQDWQQMMAVNVDGTFHAVQAAIPYLKAAGGSIVTMGSVSAFIGSAEGGGYTTSKGAVLSLSYAAAGELAPQGIRVNNVAPGWVDGGFTHQALEASDDPEALRKRACALHPLGRMAAPADVANAVVWLLSDQAAFITGSMLLVDGGFMIQH